MRRRAPLSPLISLLALMVVGSAGAEGTFQVRYFLPSAPWWSGLSADLSWRGELLGGQLDARASASGLEQQSLSATYTHERTVLLAQYDGSQTLYGTGLKSDVTALVFAQQGFEGGESGLRQLSLTALYSSSTTPSYAYRVLSGDLNAGGQFSPEWSWTLGGGLTSNDSGLSEAYTASSLSERVRASVSGKFGTEAPSTVSLQGSWDGSQSRSVDGAGTVVDGPTSSRFGVNAAASTPLSAFETLSGSARYDSSGGYGADLNLNTTRLSGWTLSAGTTLYGQQDSTDAGGNPVTGTPAALGWTASLVRAPQPWGVRVAYAGNGGSSPSEQLDIEAQYQQGSLGVQVGGGVTLRPLTTTDAANWLPAYRASVGASFQSAPPAPGIPPERAESLQVQLRLSASVAPLLLADGTADERAAGSLSGSLNYTSGPYSLQFSSSLSYSGFLTDQPWSGEVGLQGLYRVSEALQLNASVRYRPASSSGVQAGLGLRYSY
ncbi:hypothetical protein MF271_17440 (plasmid) [Deinococcus sp. KNUC1210]|uniref:hypothetical protein n=1 Tax=Deinococcus sp. KNUC1210 TaxID=2917691 RepID=UPI001EEFF116|nr:hypothetical protein [Deinococcus sp. KNUC1210]ULH16965.1 hypothetical protein MF271_17440 [Deinococcus sp. KNUC1210]